MNSEEYDGMNTEEFEKYLEDNNINLQELRDCLRSDLQKVRAKIRAAGSRMCSDLRHM